MKDDAAGLELGLQAGAARFGRLIGLDEDGAPLVELRGQGEGVVVRARTIVDLTEDHLGRDLVMAPDPQDTCSPVILGVIRQNRAAADDAGVRATVSTDAGVLTLTSEREIALVCGQASITLTQSGRIILRGTHIVSRASATNKIKGGSIQLN